jgi:tetratricopeptide (TPR) repeat protein
MEEEKISVVEALNIAIGKQNEGKLREAEAIYRGILIKVPNQPDALHLLGLIAYQLGKQDEAVKYIGKAIELKPDAAIFHGNLGMANDALGREVESAKNFVRALELDPKYENAHLANYNLGVYYDVLNQSASFMMLDGIGGLLC